MSFRPLNNLPLCFETLVVATIESCRYDKKLEDDKKYEKKWREEKYGTAGSRSEAQQTACRSCVFPTTKQPIAPLRDVVVATIESCRHAKKLENDKNWREDNYGTDGARSEAQQTACRSSVCMTTQQPTALLRDSLSRPSSSVGMTNS